MKTWNFSFEFDEKIMRDCPANTEGSRSFVKIHVLDKRLSWQLIRLALLVRLEWTFRDTLCLFSGYYENNKYISLNNSSEDKVLNPREWICSIFPPKHVSFSEMQLHLLVGTFFSHGGFHILNLHSYWIRLFTLHWICTVTH